MTERFSFRAPGEAVSVEQLVARAFPASAPDQVRDWLRRRLVSVGGLPANSPDERVEPGVRVECELDGGELGPQTWPSLRCNESEAFVLAPTPPWRRGRVAVSKHDRDNGEIEIEFEIAGERNGVAELRLTLPERVAASDSDARAPAAFEGARLVLDALARAGIVVLGDVWNGGHVMASGPAWRNAADGSHSATDDWPQVSVWPSTQHDGLRRWCVSEATARVLGRGHPWIRPDEDTDDPGQFAPGERVRVMTRDGRELGQALIDGPGAVSGRLVVGSSGHEKTSDSDRANWSVEACVSRALGRRRDFMANLDRSDAFRLVHGEADGLPGLFIDRLGPLVRVLVTARSGLELVDRALQALGPAIPNPWRIIEVLHLDERNPGHFERVRVHAYSADPEGAEALGRRCRVLEAGLVFAVAPGLEDPERSAPGVGLFLDQRENRARLAKRARRGGRYLNLFAHTGAFSVALLAAGADAVESVDLSGAYLRWLEENLALNRAAGVDASRHVSVRQDGRRHLEQLDPDDLFDGIVLDPPTAAAAGRRYFSVRRDLVPMLGQCLSHLAPGGVLLLTLNDRKARKRIEAAVEAAAEAAGVRLASVVESRPARDFPHLAGFAEGDAFRGCWVERSSD